jgi:heme exporter protein D
MLEFILVASWEVIWYAMPLIVIGFVFTTYRPTRDRKKLQEIKSQKARKKRVFHPRKFTKIDRT